MKIFVSLFAFFAIQSGGELFAEGPPPQHHSGKVLPTVYSSISRHNHIAFNSSGGYQLSVAPGIELVGATNGGRFDRATFIRFDLGLGYRTWGDVSERFSLQPSLLFGVPAMYLRVQAFDLIEEIRDSGHSMGLYLGGMMGSRQVSLVVETGLRFTTNEEDEDFKLFVELSVGLVYRFGALNL